MYPTSQRLKFPASVTSVLFSVSPICMVPVCCVGRMEEEVAKGKLRTKRGRCGAGVKARKMKM